MHHGDIQSKRKGKDLDHTMAAQAEAELREWWRGADDATKQSHRVKEGASIRMQNAFKQAQRFNVDAGLEAWVEDQNVQKGINPAPSLLLRQASMLKASLGVNAAGTRRGERRWMQRWRARRGLQLRKFPAQERLPVELMQRKVRHREGGYVRTLFVFSAPRMSHMAKKGAQFPVQFSRPSYRRGTEIEAGNRSFFSNPSHFLKIPVLPMRPKGYSIMALEQLPASPLRTGTPFGGHQHR